MLNTSSLLDAAKSRQKLPSDYKLGLTLGLSLSAISNYRNGRSHPDDVVAQRLADMAELDRGYVVACIHAERAKSDEARSLWEGIAKKLERAGALALAALAVTLSTWTGGPDAGAIAATPSLDVQRRGALCVMSNAVRRVFGRLRRILSAVSSHLGGAQALALA